MAEQSFTFKISPQLKKGLEEGRTHMRKAFGNLVGDMKTCSWDSYERDVLKGPSEPMVDEDFSNSSRISYNMRTLLALENAIRDVGLLLDGEFNPDNASFANPAAIVHRLIHTHGQNNLLMGLPIHKAINSHKRELAALEDTLDEQLGLRGR